MPARLCRSSASAPGLVLALSDGALHLSWRCGRMVPFIQRWGGRQPLLLFKHHKRWDPIAPRTAGVLCLQQPTSTQLCHTNAAMGYEGSQRDAWQD